MSTLFDELFAGCPVLLILRGLPRDLTLEYCERAWAAGIDAVEIPIQSDEAVRTLRDVSALAAGRGRVVGAGTVLTASQVRLAREAGARFTVAPGSFPDVWQECAQLGLAHLPGVATGTEIGNAMAAGHTWLKAFPARELGTGWIRAQRGPFPAARFVATGGIDSTNLADFLRAGASAVSLGSSVADPQDLVRCIAVVGEVCEGMLATPPGRC
mgnify:CR=1 FL=1